MQGVDLRWCVGPSSCGAGERRGWRAGEKEKGKGKSEERIERNLEMLRVMMVIDN